MQINNTRLGKKSLFIFLTVNILFLLGCSQSHISTSASMPSASQTEKVAVYALKNYTDTPRAGMRASNIAEGILLSKGYRVSSRINDASSAKSLQAKIADARKYNNDYIFVGGISEWRYKTGIDGEPAISLQFKLIDVRTKRVVWSAMGSDSSWGNASIGTVAQELIESMFLSQGK